MQRKISPTLVAGSLLALVLLAWNMGATVSNTSQLRRDTSQVQRSGDILRSLDNVLSLVKDAESGQRGFVITGREEYLSPYHAAVRSIGEQLRELDRLIGDDAEQQARLAEARKRVDAKLGELELTIDMRRRRGFEATREVILVGAGIAEMLALRASVDAMGTVEKRRLEERQAAAGDTYRSALVSGVASGAAALGAVLAFALLLRRHLRARAGAEQALAAEAEKFRTTLLSIGDAVIATDVHGRVTSMNAVAASLTGWTEAEALGQPLAAVFRIVDETSREPLESPATRALREGASIGVAPDAVLLRRDGSALTIDDSAAPIRSADATVAGSVLVFRDSSERRRKDQALATAQAQLRGIVMQMAIPTMVYAEDGEIVLVNEAWTRLSGHAAADIPTLREWTSRAYGPRGPEILQILQTLFGLSAVVDNGERSITTGTGETRIWHFFTAPLGRDAAGRRMLVSNAIDVTEQKRISRRLEESEARLRFALEAAGLGQWELDVRTGEATRTPGHDRIFGYAEMLPHWTVELFLRHVVPEDRAAVEHAIRDASARGAAWDLSCRILRADGEVRHIWVRASPQHDAAGALVRMLGIVGDRTREAAAVQGLQDADKRKDDFLATLAHELRNPLAPLRNSLAILQLAQGDRATFEKTRELMVRQVEHLVRLIDDLLDVSRISLDKLTLRRERAELTEILAQTVESLRPSAERAGQTLEVSLPAAAVPLDADPARLAQVFANLIGNALKFTPTGGHIRVKATHEGERAVISVRDDGIGIAAEHLRTVFEMFSQVDASLDRSQGGLGIGLNLVKRLVDLHGGSIEAKSDGLHRGSEFIVRLPVATEAMPSPDGCGLDGRAEVRPLRILVVDDNEDSADSLVMLLALEGHEPHVARDGPEALQRAAALRPEAVLLDIGLPGLNGYEVCKRLRAEPWGEEMAIIAVTGWGQDEDRRRSASAGFDGHLVKPATLADVSRALARAIDAIGLAETSLR
ncbi:MAG TPA: CHASE3 domain-containing protein [Caldimonas sp.]|nr:CHASE3 domain-containing protein [Caldimonas sp.]HEX2539873.1 CHASE3 domain-containing protein [Caldimonas sp.]